MEDYLRNGNEPLRSLETNTPLNNFDIVGFSLQYELSFTTVLNMLFIGRIPIRAEERGENDPIVIGGGPCTLNPSPISPFFDALLVGDGEEAVREIADTCVSYKMEGNRRRNNLLKKLSEINGLYVPGFSTNSVKRRIIEDLDLADFPCSPIVPYNQIVHDRINIEISRGCTCGCRFCQAGMIYRPVRERKPATILKIAEESIKNTGYDTLSLTSLSVGDYSELPSILKTLNRTFSENGISLSLPSIRVSAINEDIIKEIKKVRKTGFTIAPEAATSRLRAVINKDFDDEDYEKALYCIFKEGWLNLKLYFMIGLPTEQNGDIESIPYMAKKALRIAKKFTNRFVNINVGISTFSPRPHTPFQWCGQIPVEEMTEKNGFLRKSLHKRGLKFKWHNEQMSVLEAALARGDQSIAGLIESAWRKGSRLDSWTEMFDYTRWEEAMEETGIDVRSISEKRLNEHKPLPWDIIDTGIKKDFLYREYKRAFVGEKTGDCRINCYSCGLTCETKDINNQELTPQFQTPEINLKPKIQKISDFNLKSIRVRVIYSKKGVLRFLSHLEVVSTLLRGIRRAGVPILYSKGFHPAPDISFGPPLNVGVAGLRECFDFRASIPFDIHKHRKTISLMMPEGIDIIDMFYIPKDIPSLNKFISGYKYEITLQKDYDLDHFKSELNKEEKKWLLSMLIDFAIMYNKLTVFLKDTEDQKVKLSQIIRSLLDIDLAQIDIVRTGLYGWQGKWLEPDYIKNVK